MSKPRPSAPGKLALARSPSESLARIIRDRGLTGYQVGKLSGVDQCGVNRFLRGERDLRLATFDRIAIALGLDLVERPRGRGRPPAPVKPSPGVSEREQPIEELEEFDPALDGPDDGPRG